MNEYRSVLVAEVLAEVAEGQSGYRKYANTINATLAVVAAVITALAGQWAVTGDFPEVTAVLLVIAPVLTATVTRLTKNGVSPSVEQRVVAKARALDSEEILNARIADVVSQGERYVPGHLLPVYDSVTSGLAGGHGTAR